jgi:hypothetical protein
MCVSLDGQQFSAGSSHWLLLMSMAKKTHLAPTRPLALPTHSATEHVRSYVTTLQKCGFSLFVIMDGTINSVKETTSERPRPVARH